LGWHYLNVIGKTIWGKTADAATPNLAPDEASCVLFVEAL
jgi:hypothetical protein